MPSYQEIPPIHPKLLPYIQRYVHISGEGAVPAKKIHPKTGATIFLDFNGWFSNGKDHFNKGLSGLHETAYHATSFANTTDRLMIWFTPFGLSRFTKIPVNDFTNQIVDLEAVLGLKGKTIFITGGSAGIGKATAIAYGKEADTQVALSYFKNKEKAEDIVHNIEENGGKAMAVFMDMGDPSSIEKAVNTVLEKWNGIDVLVNNAVHWGNPANRGKKLEEMPLEQWEEMFKINLLGTVKIIQMVVPHMRQKKWGRIINLSSDIAKDSMQGSGPYGSLKAALFGLTANLVEELSADGILSNVVLPSWTLTERAKNFFPESFQEAAIRAFPTRRVTEPEDVASLILYLGSAANGHVNGEHIMVTGKGSQPMLSSLFKEHLAKRS